MTGPYGRRERPEPPEPLGVPTVDAHTHLDACGCVDAADVGAALDRAAAVGVTRVVTVADDLASARWVVDAAHWDDRVAAAVALHPTRTAAVTDADYAEIERLAARPARRRRRRDRARPLLGLLAVGRAGARVPLAHRPRQAPRQAADDPRPGRARRRPARPGRGGRARQPSSSTASPGTPRWPGPASTPGTCCRSPAPSRSRTRRSCVRRRPSCPTASCSSRRTPRSSPRTRIAAGANEPYCLPWTVRALAHVRGKPVERVADGARRTAEAVFGLAALPPAADAPAPGARAARST